MAPNLNASSPRLIQLFIRFTWKPSGSRLLRVKLRPNRKDVYRSVPARLKLMYSVGDRGLRIHMTDISSITLNTIEHTQSDMSTGVKVM